MIKINIFNSNSPFHNNKTYNFTSLTLSLTYDSLFLKNVCDGDHECAVSKIDTIVTIAETYYQAPDKLGTKIDLIIKEINYTDTELRLEFCCVPCAYACAM